MSLFCSDSLTPLVPKSTTNIAFLANLQPSPFVHYISFDLHPSHLQRLQTPPDRDWPFLGVVWYLAKVNSTSDHPFQYTYRHHAERPRPPKDGSRLLVNRGKKFSHLQSESNLWEHSVSSNLHQAVSSSSLPLACHNFQSFPVCKAMNFAKAQTRAVSNGCDKTVITVEYFLSLLLWEDKVLTSVWNSGALLMLCGSWMNCCSGGSLVKSETAPSLLPKNTGFPTPAFPTNKTALPFIMSKSIKYQRCTI